MRGADVNDMTGSIELPQEPGPDRRAGLARDAARPGVPRTGHLASGGDDAATFQQFVGHHEELGHGGLDRLRRSRQPLRDPAQHVEARALRGGGRAGFAQRTRMSSSSTLATSVASRPSGSTSPSSPRWRVPRSSTSRTPRHSPSAISGAAMMLRGT